MINNPKTLENELKTTQEKLKESNEKLQEIQLELRKSEMLVTWYEEQLKLSKKKRFGTSSEKHPLGQLSLFDEAEAILAQEEATIVVEEKEAMEPQSTRKQPKKPLDLASFSHTTIDYVLSEQEMICPTCAHELHEMKTITRKELILIPAKIEVMEHVQHVYSCRHCEHHELSATILKAKAPQGVIPHSVVSASLLAKVMIDKYERALPLYRQETYFERRGLELSRQTLSNWVMKGSEMWLKPIVELFQEDLNAMDYVQADETRLQVLHEKNRRAQSQSYMWMFKSGKGEQPVVVYKYSPTRHGEVAKAFLHEFHGILQSDGYAGYNMVGKKAHAGCWAHARRYFMDAKVAIPKGIDPKKSEAYRGIAYMSKLFKLEVAMNELSFQEIQQMRQNKSKPIMDEFFEWAKSLADTRSTNSLLSKALNYAINQEAILRTCLDYGQVELTNNASERCIKSFVIGRKNWMFCNTPNGANGSATIYSIIETAKQNRLDPQKYLTYLFETLPNLEHVTKEELKKHLPYAKEVQAMQELQLPTKKK